MAYVTDLWQMFPCRSPISMVCKPMAVATKDVYAWLLNACNPDPVIIASVTDFRQIHHLQFTSRSASHNLMKRLGQADLDTAYS